jgi:hypothetical protein
VHTPRTAEIYIAAALTWLWLAGRQSPIAPISAAPLSRLQEH